MAKRKVRAALENSLTSSKRTAVAGRNTLACNPLLRKGAAHGKTKKANRRADKISLLKGLNISGGRDGEGYLQSDNILQIVFALPDAASQMPSCRNL